MHVHKGAWLGAGLAATAWLLVALSFTLAPAARTVPMAVGWSTAILLTVLALRDALRAPDGSTMREGGTLRADLASAAWMAWLLVLLWMAGVVIALPLYLLTYLRVRSGESWLLSCGAALATWLILFGVLVVLLQLPLDYGLLATGEGQP